ncbi:hypothetical protein [Actinophytocola sp.]|uniref:hypothetical protein n=1 Tax=Actinophytocola sp. TaxID=1872138 RepID=UPI00389984F5
MVAVVAMVSSTRSNVRTTMVKHGASPVSSAVPTSSPPASNGAESDTTSTTAVSSGPRDRAGQAAAINEVLQQTHLSRQQVHDAADDVLHCGSGHGLDADARTLGDAAETREQLADQVQALPADALDDGQHLLDLLTAALRNSAQADRELAAWAQNLEDTGCEPDAATDNPHYHTSTALSEQATADKQSLLAVWNPLADEQNLPTWQPADI